MQAAESFVWTFTMQPACTDSFTFSDESIDDHQIVESELLAREANAVNQEVSFAIDDGNNASLALSTAASTPVLAKIIVIHTHSNGDMENCTCFSDR